MKLYREEDFYHDEGWPTESYRYCRYIFYTGEKTEYGPDYGQFALVVNAKCPYIRLTKKREKSHFPCGGSPQPATDGWFASLTENERDEHCPKIAWGFAAFYLANLRFDNDQQDYIELRDRNELIKGYYNKYLKIYLDSHNGLRYSKITIEQKELSFLSEHSEIESNLWDKSIPLKAYQILYNYAKDALGEYELFLRQRIKELEDSMAKKNNCFSTEICQAPSGPYIRVFFLDDSNALKAKEIVEAVNSVRKVNSGESQSASHPGHYLIVYIKPMVTAEYSEKEIHEALNHFFSNTTVGKMQIHNEAYFAGIEKRILEALDKAGATIDVCVAWFTNERLRDKLLEKQKEGIAVRVIRYHDGVNASKGVDLSELEHKEVRGERGGLLHDKFCVIDNVHTICGSYNWTLNAENKNDEDAAFHFEDYKLASTYTRRFNDIWRRGEIREPEA